MTLGEILQKLRDNRMTFRGLSVIRLGIFGSYARVQDRESSDLDLLVEFNQATLDNYFDLKFFLERLFGRGVDLVIEDAIKPRIRDAILEGTVYAQGFQYIGS